MLTIRSSRCGVCEAQISRQPPNVDIAVAQGEAEIEPDRVLDDLGREAMAAVAELSYAAILPGKPIAPDPFP